MRWMALWMVILATLTGNAYGQPRLSRRPNVLLCVADDWGWPHAGAYGDAVVKTRTFDRLARDGVLFERAFVSSPSCTPSRNAILAGQHFYRLDQGANLRSTLDVRHLNIVRLLHDAGYEVGHWRKAWGPGDFRAGGYREHPCGPEQELAALLEAKRPDEPFFFWLGTTDPHRPYEAGSGSASDITVSEAQIPPFWPDTPAVRSDLADYYLAVQRWDREVGDALALLESRGELANTIVVMTGDNGAPFPRCKANLYDWGARTPLAIMWGDHVVAPGRTAREFTSLIDLAPTFLEAAGLPIASGMTGQSLLPILRNDGAMIDAQRRDRVIIGRERHTAAQAMPSLAGYPSRALRTDRYLYIRNLEPARWPAGVPGGATHPMDRFSDCDDGPTLHAIADHADDPSIRPFYELCFAKRPAEELYEVQADPFQVRNLADDPAEQATLIRLRDQLETELRQTGDPRFIGGPAVFDDYPYRDAQVSRRIAEHRQRGAFDQPSSRGTQR